MTNTNKLPVIGKRYKVFFRGNKEFTGIFTEKYRFQDGNSFVSLKIVDKFEELADDKAETKPETQMMEIINKINPPLKESEQAFFIAGFQECLKLFYKTQSHVSELDSKTKQDSSGIPPSVLSFEVREAKEKLKAHLNLTCEQLDWKTAANFGHTTNNLANTLLNALDKQFNETSESVAIESEKVNKKEESIWKPASELPELSYTPFVFIKFNSSIIALGRIDNIKGEKQFTDITGSHQYPKSIIEKYALLTDFINDYENLKQRVKKLEGK